VADFNSQHNRLVWFDIPVADLDRAAKFYRAVLGVGVSKQEFPGGAFCVLDHEQGNGGCLVLEPGGISSGGGILCYMNAEGRIRDAVKQVQALGGKVIQDTHPIGPHGFRAIALDCEGNRIALHSSVDG